MGKGTGTGLHLVRGSGNRPTAEITWKSPDSFFFTRKTSFHVIWVLWGPEQNSGKTWFQHHILVLDVSKWRKNVNALICQSTFWKRVPQESNEQIYCWVCSTVPFGGSDSKASACNAGDLGLIPGLERFPGEGKGYQLHYSGLENSMDCKVHGVKKSWTQLTDFHLFTLWKFRSREMEKISKEDIMFLGQFDFFNVNLTGEFFGVFVRLSWNVCIDIEWHLQMKWKYLEANNFF